MKYICPCCGQEAFDEPPEKYDICPVCGFEYDPVQLADPDYAGGANRTSLRMARNDVRRETREDNTIGSEM